jgi:NAD(P)H-hydrate repair Nnr-like enzyme with NAD(P)H-hydrate dehydratase domain
MPLSPSKRRTRDKMELAQKPQIVTKQILRKIYVKRPDWSHKGNFGHVLVVGGSR